MGEFYDLIMNPTSGYFSQQFNYCWQQQLDQFPKPYSEALQLRIGNQLRPKLTCWGASFSVNQACDIDLKRVAEIASYIEMLHKASILIDDLVDGDDARHGQMSFHKQFGKNRTIIFALSLLGKGMWGINELFQKTKSHYRSLSTYSGTIYRMAAGCLEELEIDECTRYDLNKIRKIIDFETITLIKNSLLLGFWSSCNEDQDTETEIIKIGENCGYIFQILNDLEPFSSLEKNCAYKGGKNIDINRSRKNIVVAYIYGASTGKERKELSSLSNESLQELLVRLYNKYGVYEAICQEARQLENQTDEFIEVLQKVGHHTACLTDFRQFMHEMVDICFSRL